MSKILIVDDENEMVLAFSKRLLHEGYEVAVAADAYQGFALARKEKPDLILLDIGLPAGGGLKVLKSIRSHPPSMNIPVIILTASSGEESRRNFLEAGADAYFEKSCDFSDLKATIEKLLKKT
jgi:two-component system, cell cycle response regulator DivK